MSITSEFFRAIGIELLGRGVQFATDEARTRSQDTVLAQLHRFHDRLIASSDRRIPRDFIDEFNMHSHLESIFWPPIMSGNGYPELDLMNSFKLAVIHWHDRNFSIMGADSVRYGSEFRRATTQHSGAQSDALGTLMVSVIDSRRQINACISYIQDVLLGTRVELERKIRVANAVCNVSTSFLSREFQAMGISMMDWEAAVEMHDVGSDLKNTLEGFLNTLDFTLEKLQSALRSLDGRGRLIDQELSHG